MINVVLKIMGTKEMKACMWHKRRQKWNSKLTAPRPLSSPAAVISWTRVYALGRQCLNNRIQIKTLVEELRGFYFNPKIEGAQVLQKYRSHLKILAARRLTRDKSHTEYPQLLLLRATVQNLLDRGLWRQVCFCTPVQNDHVATNLVHGDKNQSV